MPKLLALAAALVFAAGLAGCSSSGDYRSEADAVGSSFRGSFGGDTYGTQRRMDVYGGATRPTLPTIGAAGYGK